MVARYSHSYPSYLLPASRLHLELRPDRSRKHKRLQSLDNDFLTDIDRDLDERVPKLSLNTDDRAYFKDRVVLRPEFRSNLQAETNSHRRIDHACELAAAKVGEIVSAYAEQNRRSVINDWIKYLEEKAMVVMLIAPSYEDAFIMFETLNDRGLEASQADLVKNHLFSKAGDRLGEAQSYWKSVVAIVESMEMRDALMEYLRHYCCVRTGATRDYQVFSRIEQMVRTKTQAIEFLISMASYANDYAAIFNPDHAKWNSYEPSIRASIDTLRLLGAQKLRPLMLAVTHCFDEKHAARTMRMLVSWAVRFLVVGGGAGGVMDKQFSLWAKKVNDGEITKRNQLASIAKSFIPVDVAFQRSFEAMRMGSSKVTRYYLRCLERTRRNDAETSLASEEDRNVNLEHILPFNPKEGWDHVKREIAADLARRLGNMVLLRSQVNYDLAGQPFTEKKQVLAESTFLLTREAAAADKWGEEQIFDRQRELAKLAVRTWLFDSEAE